MIKLGEKQSLKIVKETSFGYYLMEEDGDVEVLIPNQYILEGWNIGEEVEVFIYRDSEDRLLATTEEPKITLGELSMLKVVEMAKFGAFLDWGLKKDLFLPFKEQKGKIEKGKSYLVALYVDKSDRLCATMKISNRLVANSPYIIGDEVKGVIYHINKDMGAFVAVDNKYHGFIPNKELYGNYALGGEVKARVTEVREDGKLNLSIRKKAYLQMDDDSQMILDMLEEKDGTLPYNDKTDPEIIKKELFLSKRAFKRAIGRLLKEDKIVQSNDGIKLK